MLRIHGDKLLRLRELDLGVLHDDGQDDLAQAFPVRRNFLAAAVARPENIKHRLLEGLDRRVDERSVPRQKAFLIFDDRKLAVQVLGVPETAARLAALREIVQQGAFLRLVAMNFKTEYAETGVVHAAAHDFKSRELFRDEQDSLPLCEYRRDEVRDRLRLAGSGWPLDDKVLAAQRMYQRAVLGAVGVPD